VAKQKNDRSSHKYSNTSASIYCKDFFNPSNRAILKIEKEKDFALGGKYKLKSLLNSRIYMAAGTS
jgi:hypothetical protein